MITVIFTILLCAIIGYGLETSGSWELNNGPNWRNTSLPMKTRQRLLLEETAAFYNSRNRCVTGKSKSMYDGAYYRPEYPHGCAVGRMLTMNERKDMELRHPSTTVFGIFYDLPYDIQVFGKDFLTQLQGLHDNGSHWDKNGITESGKLYVERMMKNFELN